MASIKSKYWWGVCYPENMKEDWKENISDLLQVPYAYCIHDKDSNEADEDHRKTHIHIMIVFPNTTTEKHAKSVIKELQSGENPMLLNDSINRVINIRRAYNYLIHDTDECRNKGKYQYKPEERICGNCFDIGAYEQLGLEEKMKIRTDLSRLLLDKQFSDYATFYQFVLANYDSEYENIVVSYQGHFDKLCKGVFHRLEKARKFEEKALENEQKKRAE